MTLQELLESAHLDALGHLEPREQAAFEAAFAAAPAAIKVQVRAEQARWAKMNVLLPQVEPPAELRERVLDAVSGAMLEASMASSLALQPTRRVSTAWRAASIGLMTAVIILSTAFVNVYNSNLKTKEILQSDRLLTDWLTKMGSNYMGDSLFERSTQRIVFDDESSVGGKASIFTNPEWRKSRFFCAELPVLTGQTYRVVLVDEKNQVTEELKAFVSDGALLTLELPVLAKGTRVAIVAADLEKPASADSRVLMLARIV